jgi:FHS family L-fucose permease-like MFS transporter
MLIGRFMGAIELSELKSRHKQLLLAAVPFAGFLVLLSAKACDFRGGGAWYAVADWDFGRAWQFVRSYLPFLIGCWALFQFGRGRANRTLMLFSLVVVALLATAIVAGGPLALWCVVAVGLFTSIGWSNTFSLAIEGVGQLKSQASSLLVMAILGGAVLPPIQGYLADHTELQYSFIVPLVAYAYVAFYGAKGCRVGRA